MSCSFETNLINANGHSMLTKRGKDNHLSEIFIVFVMLF